MSSVMFILLFLSILIEGYWNLKPGVWICLLGLIPLKVDYPVLPGVPYWRLLCISSGCVVPSDGGMCMDLVSVTLSQPAGEVLTSLFELPCLWLRLESPFLLLFRTKFLLILVYPYYFVSLLSTNSSKIWLSFPFFPMFQMQWALLRTWSPWVLDSSNSRDLFLLDTLSSMGFFSAVFPFADWAFFHYRCFTSTPSVLSSTLLPCYVMLCFIYCEQAPCPAWSST